MNAEQRLAIIREQNRLRQKKYYDTHKDKILQKRKEDRIALNNLRKNNTNNTDVENVFNESSVSHSIEKPLRKTKQKLSEDYVIGELQKLNKPQYVSHIKTVFKLTGCADLTGCLLKFDEIKKQIYKGKKSNGEPYQLNSIKSFYQSIVYVLDHIENNIPKKTADLYKNEFEILKVKSNDQTVERQNDESYGVTKFSKYKDLVKKKFGENSKEFLIVSLYDEATLRDNFGKSKIFTKKEKEDYPSNYFVVPKDKKKNVTFYLNEYKTVNKYGKTAIEFSSSTSALIRNYMRDNNLTYGDELFNTNLSKLVGNINKALNIGATGGINYIRQSKITEDLSLQKNLSAEKRVELSKQLKHSLNAQVKYIRGLK